MAKHVCCIGFVLLFSLCAFNAATGASISRQQREFSVGKTHDFPASRQNDDVYNSSEDSDEDDEEGDEEQQQKYAAAQQAAEETTDESDEDDAQDDDDGLLRRRRRRDVAAVEVDNESSPQPESEADAEKLVAADVADTESTEPTEAELQKEQTTVSPTIATLTTRKPVLVLIRDALKKVTTGLPTEQVANNALQYFQLFEHFIQQTIEQVINDDDDDEDEQPAAASAANELVAAVTEQPAESGIKAPEEHESAPIVLPNEAPVAKPEPVAEQPATEEAAAANISNTI